MGFAAAELHEMPLSPSQATNFFLRIWGFFSCLGGSGCKTLLKSDTTCVCFVWNTQGIAVLLLLFGTWKRPSHPTVIAVSFWYHIYSGHYSQNRDGPLQTKLYQINLRINLRQGRNQPTHPANCRWKEKKRKHMILIHAMLQQPPTDLYVSVTIFYPHPQWHSSGKQHWLEKCGKQSLKLNNFENYLFKRTFLWETFVVSPRAVIV